MQGIYVKTVFCSFSRLQNFWKIYGYIPEYPTFSFMIKHFISQIFLKTQRSNLQIVDSNSP